MNPLEEQLPQRQTIVAEISKTCKVYTHTGETDRAGLFLSIKFEEVIEVNRKRGYKLASWHISQVTTPLELVETIIAVFTLKE